MGRLHDERMATRSLASGGMRCKYVDWAKKRWTEAVEGVVGPLHRVEQTSSGDLLLDSMETLGFMAPASFVKGGGPLAQRLATQGHHSSGDAHWFSGVHHREGREKVG